MTPLEKGSQAVLALIKELGRPPLHTLSPAEAREASAKSGTVLQPEPPEVAAVQDLTCPGLAGDIRLRQYRGAGTAASAVLPCLVYLHGGGWVIGDLDSHDLVCRVLANTAGCAVISVHYRLAPEHRFPAAVEDSAAAFAHVAANAAALGIDPARLAVGGDSAGGNLAAVLAIMGRDGTLPSPRFQMLLYPTVDLASRWPSYYQFTEGLILTAPTMDWFIDHYIPDHAQRTDWRASPYRAASLAGVAPAYVMTAAHDPLRDEGIAYAQRLEREGVPVIQVHMADQMHAFLTMGKFCTGSDLALRQAALAMVHGWKG
jgi:acetyl esterase